ncbi:uncharacterized protein RHOBADRAFT_54794 [Rhodotorula graminis WP1]|uniref:N-acetyltransferase domain-containing protein n=1 Tax=Rhodotorula graminis (strain WP1) TaxID=578459 RepID=A0A0P9H101_RHOGW|nr:uncharacterized protein RHOBADRAFT_54794 [Rhodotorula graminis WP1]KPV73590.1 hypothetical protein RHOBADRAFT_54794 [Rhodotorula graminis WP1]
MVPHRHAPLPELYRLADPAPLLDLVRPNLLDALPLYSTLQTPGLATPLYASFPSFDPDGKPQLVDAAQPDLWLALVDLGNQLRFFCSYEAHDHLTGDQVAQGESLVVGALTSAHTGISIGAIPDTWTSCIARAFSQPFSASRIHYLPLDEVPSTSGGAVLPGGIVCTEGREEDIEEILSTSEVPHPPAYLSTRLAHTPDAAEPPSRILAHCTTHRDGSIGTLHVAPSARQRGLGQLVLLARARAMASPSSSSSTSAAKADEPPPPLRDAPVFCYVHRENEASNALMRRAGMRIARDGAEVWWARVRLPLRNTGFEMDEDGP